MRKKSNFVVFLMFITIAMPIKRRKIAAFDFDGTLIKKDSLLMFIQFAVGSLRLLQGLLLFSPLIVLMKLGLYDNGRCKEQLFSWFFKGMPHSEFEELGKKFVVRLSSVARPTTTEALARYREIGREIYVITASIEEWVRPYCETLGVRDVIATQAEVDNNGLLTGRFSTPNCHGSEKVRRLLIIEPDREAYHLVAYGDSSGDKELFSLADEHFKV